MCSLSSLLKKTIRSPGIPMCETEIDLHWRLDRNSTWSSPMVVTLVHRDCSKPALNTSTRVATTTLRNNGQVLEHLPRVMMRIISSEPHDSTRNFVVVVPSGACSITNGGRSRMFVMTFRTPETHTSPVRWLTPMSMVDRLLQKLKE